MDDKKGENKDHLSPTNIENTAENVRNEPDLSHEELQERLDNYSKVGGEKETYFSLQKIKQKYLKEIEQKQASRNKGSIHYAQGIRSGLPHKDYEEIKDMHNEQDRKMRNDVVNEAKEEYQAKNSLSKSFKEKDKEMDIDL